MPRVKVDYVVSFSNEDPENPANNLLEWNVGKKKWLCTKGEPSCSVVLQLVRSVKISAVHIGAYHSALVEVLVGRSERPNDPYKVLVPSCVFVSPAESRRDEDLQRVRSFSGEQLAEDARDAAWDRVRVVCSQPYNKHCKYGLSFIHIFESEDKAPAAWSPPSRSFALDALGNSSDEEQFKPGELFAKHLSKPNTTEESTTNIGAQIRQATSQALQNVKHSSTTLIKTPISKTSAKRPSGKNENVEINRQKDSLMYTSDDERPNKRIDGVLKRHKDDKNKSETTTKKKVNEKDESKIDKTTKENHEHSRRTVGHESGNNSSNIIKPSTSKEDRIILHRQTKRDEQKTKNTHSKSKQMKEDTDMASSEPHLLLQDVVFALSGYENPRRAQLRAAALAMGARYQRDWSPACTHLICAFPNTPKLRAVRSSQGGSSCIVVTGEWVERCAQERRRLPWQWFATEPHQRRTPPKSPPPRDPSPDSECDTDDEIEKVLHKQKKHKTNRSPSPADANASHGSDVEFVRDERLRGEVAVDDSDTDVDVPETAHETIDPKSTLPDFFEGYTFVIDDDVEQVGFDKDLLRRYIIAYGGVLVEPSQDGDESEVNYRVSATGNGVGRVRADWVWRCHKARQRVDPY